MNHSIKPPEPMTDIARLLASRTGETALATLVKSLEEEVMRVNQQMTRGLSSQAFSVAKRRVIALRHAQAVLKAVRIYLAT